MIAEGGQPHQRFKYLKDKPVNTILEGELFTQMLAAEAEGLLTIVIALDEQQRTGMESQLMNIWDAEYSDGDDLGDSWSQFRYKIVRDALSTLLLPKATEWLKDDLRQTSEDSICQRCQDELEKVSLCLCFAQICNVC
jgi:transcription elongation factor SPT6